MKPLLLLDVDGVLCPFEGHLRLEAILGNEVEYPGFTFDPWARVFWCQEIADRVTRLMDKFEIHWCTGWQEEANDVISPLHGLPRFPVVPILTLDLEPGHCHWKQGAIEAYIENHYPDRPYAFVDDEINRDGETYGKMQNVPTLWLPTHHHTGLTDEHVEKLEKFADELAPEYSAC